MTAKSTADYTVTDPEQKARFIAFVRQCNDLIRSSAGHRHVVAFLATQDIDAMRALRRLADEAVCPELVGLIGARYPRTPVAIDAGAGWTLSPDAFEKLMRYAVAVHIGRSR